MRIILVTGAGSGLGAEIAKCCGKPGSHIILVGRTREKLEKVGNAIAQNGGSSECIICDISNPDSVKGLVRSVRAKRMVPGTQVIKLCLNMEAASCYD